MLPYIRKKEHSQIVMLALDKLTEGFDYCNLSVAFKEDSECCDIDHQS
jgi:hypothetical protein